MHAGLKVRRWLIGGVAALVLTGAFSAVAMAGSPYTVHEKVVPSTVPLNHPFKVTMFGLSANTSVLRLYLNRNKPCAVTAAADAALPGNFLKFATQVTNGYSITKTFVGKLEGRHYACAYLNGLPPQKLPRARAGASYAVG
jgi:hypothetical protein